MSEPRRAMLAEAFEEGKRLGKVEAMADAALGMAAGQAFGTHPGRVPAYLHEAYRLADGAIRIRLAAALARIWVYGYQPWHAEPFAAEAVALAERANDPVLLAEALDAALLVSWGPDQLDARVAITARLEEAVAHLHDVPARLSAYLWRLTTATESLDAVAMQRQLRALDGLAEDSGQARVRFFATSRRGMHALLRGDLPEADRLRRLACEAGAEAGEADTEAIAHELAAAIALQRGDRDALVREAEASTQFGTAEGIPSVVAAGARLWVAAGEPELAGALLGQLTGGGLGAIARDVDWLLTVCLLTEVAAGLGEQELAREAVDLLVPYAGRGVVNAGAVTFLGVVDDFLRMACTALGRSDDAEIWAARAAAGYARVGATGCADRLHPPRVRVGPARIRLSRGPDGIWQVGADGRTTPVRDMRGLRYLRLLLARPGVEVPAQQLSDEASGHGADSVAQRDLGELIDRQAAAAYRARIAALDAELDEARDWADPARAARAQAERDALVAHLAAAAGLRGRQRTAGATDERARVAVRKAIAAATDRLDAIDPGLARLLRDTVRTGSTCRYDPDPARPVVWLLDE